MFWAGIWKISDFFFLIFFFFLVVKFSIYLNRHVFVMKRKSKNLPKCIQTPYCAIYLIRFLLFIYILDECCAVYWLTAYTLYRVHKRPESSLFARAFGVCGQQRCAATMSIWTFAVNLLNHWLIRTVFSTANALIDSVHVRLIWVIDLLQTLKTSSPDAAHVPFGVLSLRKHAYSNI